METTEQFEHYHVLRRDDGTLWELGRGAMGVTYKALDADLHCEVALKVITPSILGNEEAGLRFLREARSLARLRHPNIATIYRLGRTGDGSYFYAMEFCEGQTLQQFVERQGVVAPAVALDMVEQISKALMLAEDFHLVHRDLKPANLMLTHRRDEGMVIKVIDFGLAKNYGGGEAHPTAWVSLNTAGFIGTAHFASPEQLEERELDTRADIYSLGATLWFLLTGKPMFAGSLAKVMNQHLAVPAPLEQLRGRVPPPVIALLGRMLEKDRDLRPDTAADLRREVQTCLRAVRPGGGDATATIAQTTAGSSFSSARREDEAPAETIPLSTPPAMASGMRYRLLDEPPLGRSGRLFRAVDTADHDAPVTVRVLGGTLVADKEALKRFAAEIEKVRAHPHPGFLRVHPLAAGPEDAPWLVTEWVTGFTLLDVLRARHTLGLRETLGLLGMLAAAADHAAAHRLAGLELEKHQLFFHFPDAATPGAVAGLAGVPSAEWPTFAPKLNAVGLPPDTLAPAAQSLAAMATLSPGTRSGAGRDYPRELAALTYELLGGANPAPGGARDTARVGPLSRLSEAGNAVLQRALCAAPGQGYATARALFDALESTAGYESTHPQVADAPTEAAGGRRSVDRRKIGVLAGAGILLALGMGVYLWSATDKNAHRDTPDTASSATVAAVSASPAPTVTGADAKPTAAELEAKLLAIPSTEQRRPLLTEYAALVTNDFISKLGQEGDQLSREGQAEAAKQRFTLLAEAAGLKDNASAQAMALAARGDLYRNAGEMIDALKDYQLAETLAAAVPDNAALRATVARGMGMASLKLARWLDAASAFHEEIALGKNAPNTTDLADAWNNLGVALMGQNDYPGAIEALENSRTVSQDIGYTAGANHAQQNLNICRASTNWPTPTPTPASSRPPAADTGFVYQATGQLLHLDTGEITFQKGGDQWRAFRTGDTAVASGVAVGATVVVHYAMHVVAFAKTAGAAGYQCTGYVTQLGHGTIALQKGAELWHGEFDPALKVPGTVKVGAVVTLYYRLRAVSVK